MDRKRPNGTLYERYSIESSITTNPTRQFSENNTYGRELASTVVNSADKGGMYTAVVESVNASSITPKINKASDFPLLRETTRNINALFKYKIEAGGFGNISADDNGMLQVINETFFCNRTLLNETFHCYNTTNQTLGDSATTTTLQWWTLTLILFPLLTFFGNSLVCLSVYREKSLQSATNYFIVSLAVADILVSLLVMPLGVYNEVNENKWELGDLLCDAWVSCDVMACTASILNLTAISIDRFMAVTAPIYYAKHRNSKRVHFTLALVWVISLAIALPIAAGQNTSPARTSDVCFFWNSDFLIYSSLISFYIPCVIMILLYGRIFMVIRSRAKKALRNKRKIKGPTNSVKTRKDSDQSLLTPHGTPIPMLKAESKLDKNLNGCHLHVPIHLDHASISVAGSSSSTNDGDDNAGERDTMMVGSCDSGMATLHNDETKNKMELGDFDKKLVRINMKKKNKGFPNLERLCIQKNDQSIELVKSDIINKTTTATTTRLSVRTPEKKKKDKVSQRRERKATKTLAIVLGVFLVCWVPFFTVNIINAICIRYDYPETGACSLRSMSDTVSRYLYGFLVWLGYMNSFMNPVIYTIFNMEFRKAFKKILGIK